MSKWKIKHEKFDDSTIGKSGKKRIKRVISDHQLKSLAEAKAESFKGRYPDGIVAELIKVHGDKYDYSKVEYVDYGTKLTIICPEHGEFHQTFYAHRKGHGCTKCAKKRTSSAQTFSNDQVIAKFREVHGERFDYSKVEYVNQNVKVIIICPEHGEFQQVFSNHLKTENPCPQCHKIARSKSVSGYKHSDETKQKMSRQKSKISDETREKIRIANIEKGRKRRISQVDVIKSFQSVHGDQYDYSKVEYVLTGEKVIIICPKHGQFLQTPHLHKRGHGCMNCAVERRTKRSIKRVNPHKTIK